jgi:hypothetical protein
MNKNIIFFFYKVREQEGRTSSVWVAGASGRREDVGKGCRRVNMVQILCTNGCKWKNETCSNYSRNRSREISRMIEGANLTMMYYNKFCKCQCNPQYNNNNNKFFKKKICIVYIYLQICSLKFNVSSL